MKYPSAFCNKEIFNILTECLISCKPQRRGLRTAATVSIYLLATLTMFALSFFSSQGTLINAQSRSSGLQPLPAHQFPPSFPPGNNANFLRLQVVQRSGPSTDLSNGIGTSVALCHPNEQVVGGGFVERGSASISTSPRQSSTHPAIDFRVLASFRPQPPTNGWTVRAFGSDSSFAALAQCARIVMQ